MEFHGCMYYHVFRHQRAILLGRSFPGPLFDLSKYVQNQHFSWTADAKRRAAFEAESACNPFAWLSQLVACAHFAWLNQLALLSACDPRMAESGYEPILLREMSERIRSRFGVYHWRENGSSLMPNPSDWPICACVQADPCF